jgi:predicted ArsR family transcriptional regulator
MDGAEFSAAVAAIAALGDPTRSALYRYIAERGVPVGREDAAAAVGVPHHVARFHLDRLLDAGLLQVEYKRPSGRGGPGAGRPTKLYRPVAAEFAVSVPERRYDIAGLILTRAAATAIERDVPVAQALEEAAGEAGRAIGKAAAPDAERSPRPQEQGADAPSQPGVSADSASQPGVSAGRSPQQRRPRDAVLETLDAQGFRPRPEGDGYVLGNCPFHALAQQAPDVVCRMNLALINGMLEEVGGPTAAARLDPAEGRCCVTVRP